jgi:hypothetical protein
MHPQGIDIFGSSRSEPDPPKALRFLRDQHAGGPDRHD